MARSWLITSRGIAKKIKDANLLPSYQIKDVGVEAKRECPNCNYLIDNSDVTLEWPGLPAGVKFDPLDVELLEHLEGKIGINNTKPHMFIDEFIPTLKEEEGICYTHPENLPGVKKDGSSIHFFHRTSNAYGTGQRKRRKINHSGMSEERVRWHKTGKTKPVLENGVHKGWKKIMVLYRSSKKGCKPDKANWVMHQYHLGLKEDEKNGELVVSKIFYQQAYESEKNERDQPNKQCNILTAGVDPKTPKTNTPQPPRVNKSSPSEVHEDSLPLLLGQEQEDKHAIPEVPLSPLPAIPSNNEVDDGPAWWVGESQAVDEPGLMNLHESLLCHEVLDSFPPVDESCLHFKYPTEDSSRNEALPAANSFCGLSDFDNILSCTPPELQLSDLQFGSQDSIMSWLDRF